MSSNFIIVQQIPEQIQELQNAGYSLVTGIPVSTNGRPEQCNTVFEENSPAPFNTISLPLAYGFNYSNDVPVWGQGVSVSGSWEVCDFGQTCTLTKDGVWQVGSEVDLGSDAMVVRNEYQDVSIIIGALASGGGGWQPVRSSQCLGKLIQHIDLTCVSQIFFSEGKLTFQDSALYQPVKHVRMWYAQSQHSGDAVPNQVQNAPFEYDYATGASNYFQYEPSTGKWSNQSTPFPPS